MRTEIENIAAVPPAQSVSVITGEWTSSAVPLVTPSNGQLGQLRKSEQQQELTSNQTKWASFMGDNHSGYVVMKQSHYCHCGPEYLGPFVVVVSLTETW